MCYIVPRPGGRRQDLGAWAGDAVVRRPTCNQASTMTATSPAGGASTSMAVISTPSKRAAASAPGEVPGKAILVVDDIVKRFETPDGILTAVDHLSFAFAPAEFWSVICPSTS